MISDVIATWCVVLVTSTTGVATRTSSRWAPTAIVACTVATNIPLSTISARVTGANPARRNVRLKVPAGRPSIA